MNDNWTVKAKKKSDSPSSYDSKKNLVWDGVARNIVLCSVNPTKNYAEIFAKQVKKNDIDNLWKIWITDGSIEETIELTEEEITQCRNDNKKKKKKYENLE